MSNNFINNFLIVLGKNKKANPRKNKIGIAIIKIIGEKMRSGIKTPFLDVLANSEKSLLIIAIKFAWLKLNA